MKLSNQYEMCEINGEVVLVYLGKSELQPPHVMQANPTAGIIVKCLKKETTREEIYTAIEERFAVDRQELISDVETILNQLREHGALAEE